MRTLLVMGYSSFDLGIFKDSDVKVTVIKTAIERALARFFENGTAWLIFTGALGFEYWALQVAKEMQKDYDFQIATIFDFETHGQNWNEANQSKLALFKDVDYVKYAYPSYENPGQFRQYQDFLLENSDGAFIFYDDENETKLKYMVEKIRDNEDYGLELLDFEDLQEISEELTEELNEAAREAHEDEEYDED